MNYAKIENGQIVKIGPTPNWRTDDGPLTPEQWRDQGYIPVVYAPPEYDPALQRVTIKDRSEWVIETDRVVATYEVHDIPIEQLRDTKLRAATEMRWEVMTGGIALPNGVEVGTSIDDQNRITSVVANANHAGLADEDTVDFKTASGWLAVTIGDIKAMAGAIGQFVQACFTAERTHHEAIAALTEREAVATYDVSTGWPTNATSPDSD